MSKLMAKYRAKKYQIRYMPNMNYWNIKMLIKTSFTNPSHDSVVKYIAHTEHDTILTHNKIAYTIVATTLYITMVILEWKIFYIFSLVVAFLWEYENINFQGQEKKNNRIEIQGFPWLI